MVKRWKKTALLVFSALGLASAKTKCAVCAWAFQYAAQLIISCNNINYYFNK
jgi:hypothetical protein